MADINLTIADPIALAVTAVSNVAVKLLDLAVANRETASQAARDAQDRINAQIYWDWRATLKYFHVVGDEMPWPPKANP